MAWRDATLHPLLSEVLGLLRQGLDAAGSINPFRHFERHVQLAHAPLLHQLVALGFFLRLGLGQRLKTCQHSAN